MASFFNTIILLGAIQGIIISSLLYFSKRNTYSNRILAALILLISLASFNLYGSYHDWFHSDLLRFLSSLVPLVMIMPLGPLIYFYFQSSLNTDFRVTKKERPHFYPVLVDLVPSFTVIVFIIGIVTKLVHNNPEPWGLFIDDYNVYADIPRWVSVTCYVWLAARFLKAYLQKNNGLLNGHAFHVKWLQQFIRVFMVFQAIWFIFLVPYIIPAYSNQLLDAVGWYPVYIPLAILIYWLGIKGYIISQQEISAAKKNNGISAALPPETIRQVVAALTKAMEEEKIFLNASCNLASLSAATGFAQKMISAVLNQQLETSFNEFVNGYRIAAFKEKIRQPEMNRLTIAGIARECGFNSQATFQRTFKEFTGKSPSEFRKTAIVAS